MKFEFLDIAPSDAAFRAYGKDLDEVFENSALAMMKTMTDIDKVEKKESLELEATGYDLNSLMFDWLSNLLYVVSAEGYLFSEFEISVEAKGDGYELKARCLGEHIDLDKHEMDAEVKAVTYHKMEIRQDEKKSGWVAQVVLDL